MTSLAMQAVRLSDYFASGGVVMWPLAALSVWAWTLVLLKGRQLASWRRGEVSPESVIQRVLEEQPAKHETTGPTCSRPISTLKNEAIDNWQYTLASEFMRRRIGDPALNERLLHRLAHRHADEAERGVGTILVFAATAPLLGLLGTVAGMIGAFDALAAWGAAHPRELSHGISEALVSTQTGLLVAIPVLFAGQFLRRRARTFSNRVDRFCAALARASRGCELNHTALSPDRGNKHDRLQEENA